MNCLQCNKPATQAIAHGYTIMECSDGHRTGLLTLEQTNEIKTRLGMTDEVTDVAELVVPVKAKTKRQKKAA